MDLGFLLYLAKGSPTPSKRQLWRKFGHRASAGRKVNSKKIKKKNLKSVNNALKNMASFGCIAHPGMHSNQVMLLWGSTPCARLELLWPALCTGAVVDKLLVNHSRTRRHSLSTIVSPRSTKNRLTTLV